MSQRVERVLTWAEFKELLTRLHPSELYYAQGNAPLASPPVELRLIFVAGGVQYIFVDTAQNNVMRRTRIPVYSDKYGNYSLKEDSIRGFIYSQLGKNDVRIHSFELMGGY